MRVSKMQIERWNITNRLNREAKSIERSWRNGLKKKEQARKEEEWEVERISVACLIFRSKTFSH
jgi:hypothetical protein